MFAYKSAESSGSKMHYHLNFHVFYVLKKCLIILECGIEVLQKIHIHAIIASGNLTRTLK